MPKTAKRPRQSKATKSVLPVVEPVMADGDPGADGEAEGDDGEVVEVKKLVSRQTCLGHLHACGWLMTMRRAPQPRRTTRRSVAASNSPPFDPAPPSLPSTARKSRKSAATPAKRVEDPSSPIQDNVQVVVPSTVQRVARKKPSVADLQEESEPEEEKEKGVSKAGKIAEEVRVFLFYCPSFH